MTPLRQRMIEDTRLRNLSANTQRLYVRQVARFAQFFGKSPDLLGPEDVRSYQVYLSQQKSASWSTLNLAVSALRFHYRITLEREWALGHIPLPKKPQTLPAVLSQEEVCRFFQNISNFKHRAIVMTAYATGLRVSEVASLRVTDIDSDRMMIRVQLGKGQTDRYVMLSPHLLELLRAYWKLVTFLLRHTLDRLRFAHRPGFSNASMSCRPPIHLNTGDVRPNQILADPSDAFVRASFGVHASGNLLARLKQNTKVGKRLRSLPSF